MMAIWTRLILVLVCGACAYLILRPGTNGAGTVALCVASLLITRLVYASKLAENPFGEKRD